MNNKDFAKVLLSEATELLESADIDGLYKKTDKRISTPKAKESADLAILLTETASILTEGPNYTVERGNLLYANNKFIGSFDNEKEKQELIDEYEEEHKEDK